MPVRTKWKGWLHKLNKGFLGGWSLRYCVLLYDRGDLVAFRSVEDCTAALAADGSMTVSKIGKGKVLLNLTSPEVTANFVEVQGRRSLRFVFWQGAGEGKKVEESRCLSCDDPNQLCALLLAVDDLRSRIGVPPLQGSGAATAQQELGEERGESFHSAGSDSDAENPAGESKEEAAAQVRPD